MTCDHIFTAIPVNCGEKKHFNLGSFSWGGTCETRPDRKWRKCTRWDSVLLCFSFWRKINSDNIMRIWKVELPRCRSSRQKILVGVVNVHWTVSSATFILNLQWCTSRTRFILKDRTGLLFETDYDALHFAFTLKKGSSLPSSEPLLWLWWVYLKTSFFLTKRRPIHMKNKQIICSQTSPSSTSNSSKSKALLCFISFDGVPQGCVLGPVFFIAFTHFYPPCRRTIHKRGLSSDCYADDAQVYRSGVLSNCCGESKN